jgi:hypothetical protein
MGLGSMTAARAAAMDGLAVMNRGSAEWASSNEGDCGREQMGERVLVIRRRWVVWVVVIVLRRDGAWPKKIASASISNSPHHRTPASHASITTRVF